MSGHALQRRIDRMIERIGRPSARYVRYEAEYLDFCQGASEQLEQMLERVCSATYEDETQKPRIVTILEHPEMWEDFRAELAAQAQADKEQYIAYRMAGWKS